MKNLKGQCLCGSVQYTIEGQPQLSFLCQCQQCQKITGTGHSAEFAVLESETSIMGLLHCYQMKADTGNTISSLFCPTCGNPILKKSSGHVGLLFFHAATLESPEKFQPTTVFWASSGQPWDNISSELNIKQYQ